MVVITIYIYIEKATFFETLCYTQKQKNNPFYVRNIYLYIAQILIALLININGILND